MKFPRQRVAYGRHRRSAPLVEQVATTSVFTERDAPLWIPRRAVDMPRGGVRTLLTCLCCDRSTMWLYRQSMFNPDDYLCRVCAGLRYQSQYQGRRPEAHAEALMRLAESSQIATTERARERRHARYMAASKTATQRISSYVARREVAFTCAMLGPLVRAIKREHRDWERNILPAVLREPTDVQRDIADNADTPAWARAILYDSLAEPIAAQAARQAAEDDREMLSMGWLTEMRAAYQSLNAATGAA